MTKQISLLEKAKSIHSIYKNRCFTQEECELAKAWANREIAMWQVSFTICGDKRSAPKTYSFLAGALAQIIREKG